MRKFILVLFSLLLLASLALAPGQAQVAQANPGTVVYNLYATDGYIELPDGLPLYMYGFIGGRELTPLTYQTRFTPGLVPTNVTVAGGPVAPQGGGWTGQDAQFAGTAQYPAPLIYATEGDVVEIRLKNLGVAANPLAPNDPHSIHLHGLDVDAANDGVPETSLGAVPANLCANGTTAANGICGPKAGGPALGAGNVIVYMFSPDHAGTFMYHCHQEADIHVQMGMYGALVVYNQGDAAAAFGPGQGLGGNLYGHSYDKDYVLLLTEFDVRGHQAEEGTYKPQSWDPKPYNWALYQPQYWQINGLSFPNTIHANWPSGYTWAQWIAAHPGYDPLISGSVSAIGANSTWGTPGEKALLRVINLGFETHPMHMHGYHGKILGSDSRGWFWTNAPFNSGLEKNTLTIGSGETYDWLVDFGQQAFQSVYPPDSIPPSSSGKATESRYYDGTPACQASLTTLGLPVPAALNTPVSNKATGCPAIPEFGIPLMPPYIGGPTVTGAVGLPPATSQFFPFHNHDDYKATNNGVYPGGMFTMIVPTP